MFKTSKSIAALMLAVASIGFPAAASASDFDDVFLERYDSPEDVGVLGRFVSKAVEVGQYDQAISTLEQHLIKYPRDARARLNLASVYANTGSWELAARNLEVALSVGDLTPEETKQAEELAAKVKGALSGFEWVLDMTVGIRSKWLDVEDELNSWKDRQDWNPFAAVNTALKIDLDTPLDDVLVISASGLVERRYEDINQGDFDPFDPFDLTNGIYAHHRGRIAFTLDKGVPVVDLDAMRIQISAFGQFRTYNPSVSEVALGTSVRTIVQPSVDTAFYGEVSYANLEQSTNLSANHRFGAEAGASRRLTAEHTVGMAARYQREMTDGGTTVNRQREIEMNYAGVLPYRVFGALWTHQVAGALG
ncbi:MAG: tetratricopeptide repeat protein, partial [Anderseniella sp.]